MQLVEAVLYYITIHTSTDPRQVFQACPTGGDAEADYVSRLACKRLGILPKELEGASWVRKVWAALHGLVPPQADPG